MILPGNIEHIPVICKLTQQVAVDMLVSFEALAFSVDPGLQLKAAPVPVSAHVGMDTCEQQKNQQLSSEDSSYMLW